MNKSTWTGKIFLPYSKTETNPYISIEVLADTESEARSKIISKINANLRSSNEYVNAKIIKIAKKV